MDAPMEGCSALLGMDAPMAGCPALRLGDLHALFICGSMVKSTKLQQEMATGISKLYSAVGVGQAILGEGGCWGTRPDVGESYCHETDRRERLFGETKQTSANRSISVAP